MSDDRDDKTINETLNIIRKALSDESDISLEKDNTLVLNKLINDDGTISIINENLIKKDEIKISIYLTMNLN